MRKLFAIVCLALLGTGCVLTPIRRSAFVPRNSVPANHGAPIGDAGVKVFGHVNSWEVPIYGPTQTIGDLLGELPSEGAAGLWIPRVQVGGGIIGAANDMIEFGGQFSYTHLDWAEPNLIGVLEFPPGEDNQQIFMGGPNFRVNIPIEDAPVTPAIVMEASLATIPQAVYVRNGETTVDEDGLNVPEYEFVRIDRKSFILPTLAAHLSVEALEVVNVVGMFGIQRNVKNIGFDPNPENLDEDTLEGYVYLFAGIGGEVRYDKFFMTLVTHTAFGKPPEIRFGFSLSSSIGVVFN